MTSTRPGWECLPSHSTLQDSTAGPFSEGDAHDVTDQHHGINHLLDMLFNGAELHFGAQHRRSETATELITTMTIIVLPLRGMLLGVPVVIVRL